MIRTISRVFPNIQQPLTNKGGAQLIGSALYAIRFHSDQSNLESVQNLMSRAQIYHKLEKADKASELYNKIIASYDSSTEAKDDDSNKKMELVAIAYNELANIEASTDTLDAALEKLNKAVEIEKKRGTDKNRLAFYEDQLSNLESRLDTEAKNEIIEKINGLVAKHNNALEHTDPQESLKAIQSVVEDAFKDEVKHVISQENLDSFIKSLAYANFKVGTVNGEFEDRVLALTTSYVLNFHLGNKEAARFCLDNLAALYESSEDQSKQYTALHIRNLLSSDGSLGDVFDETPEVDGETIHSSLNSLVQNAKKDLIKIDPSLVSPPEQQSQN